MMWDFEKWPEEHCKKAPELLAEIGASRELVHAVCSHGYGICSDVEPELLMEKILFAADELTGLIWAAALMRPSKSVMDMEVKSIKKKFKDKRFAAGCSGRSSRGERTCWDGSFPNCLKKLWKPCAPARRTLTPLWNRNNSTENPRLADRGFSVEPACPFGQSDLLTHGASLIPEISGSAIRE